MKKLGSILSMALLVLCGLVSGCATTDPENLSERPWNSPKSWEHGLPGAMMPRY